MYLVGWGYVCRKGSVSIDPDTKSVLKTYLSEAPKPIQQLKKPIHSKANKEVFPFVVQSFSPSIFPSFHPM